MSIKTEKESVSLLSLFTAEGEFKDFKNPVSLHCRHSRSRRAKSCGGGGGGGEGTFTPSPFSTPHPHPLQLFARLERERLHCRLKSGRCDNSKKIALDEYMLLVLLTEFYWRDVIFSFTMFWIIWTGTYKNVVYFVLTLLAFPWRTFTFISQAHSDNNHSLNE